jgi:hypothetical protein
MGIVKAMCELWFRVHRFFVADGFVGFSGVVE